MTFLFFNSLLIVALFLNVISSPIAFALSNAKIQSVQLQWKPSSQPTHWLFEGSQKFQGPKNLSDLAEIKKLELAKNYSACAEKTYKALNRHRDLAHWILMEALTCINRANEIDSDWKHPIVMDWYEKVLNEPELFQETMVRDELVDEWYRLSVNIVQNSKWDQKFRWKVANAIYPLREELPKSFKAEFFRSLGVLTSLSGFKDLAKTYSQKADQVTKESNGKEAKSSLSSGSNGKFLPDPATGGKSKEELLFLKFNEALTRNFWGQVADYAVDYLEKYPGGVKANYVSEKLINQYINFFTNGSSDQKVHINQWRLTMGKAHPSKLEEWARVMHRQGDFEGALSLALKALTTAEGGPVGAPLLYIAGRCQYFLGHYDEALKLFDKLLERHTGYSENTEVRFRRGLIFLRTEKWAEADKAFADLSSAPDSKSYGLSALYWLIRVREKQGAKTDDLLKIMQDKYYLTYYGLKLQAEKNNQKVQLDWPKMEPMSETFYFSELEAGSWSRVQQLIQAGWYLEAQRELAQVFSFQTQSQKILVANVLAQAFSYPTVFTWAVEFFDQDPSHRTKDLLNMAYPFPFRDWIETETKKYDLSPYLIISLMRQESAFNLKATSTAQAQGLMQLIPATVHEVAQDLKMKNIIMDDMYNPPINIKFGTYYLAKVIRQFQNNVSVGLAAYNAGPLRLKKFFEGRPELLKVENLSQADVWSDLWVEELPWLETNLYVKSILRNAIIYQLVDKTSLELPNPAWSNLSLQKK